MTLGSETKIKSLPPFQPGAYAARLALLRDHRTFVVFLLERQIVRMRTRANQDRFCDDAGAAFDLDLSTGLL